MKQQKSPTILYFDIETCPCLASVWGSGKQVVSDEQILEWSRIICISYMFETDKKPNILKWDNNQCDKQMLIKFHKVLSKADYAIGHNGRWFDVKHVNTRFAYHRLEPMPILSIEDSLEQVRRHFRLPSNKLRFIARYFDLPVQKMRTDYQLWLEVWRKNNKKELAYMCQYCNIDTVLLKEVVKRIEPYCKFKINRNILNGKDLSNCPSCGGTLVNNGYNKSSLSIKKRMKCTQCYKSIILGKNLIKEWGKSSSEIPR